MQMRAVTSLLVRNHDSLSLFWDSANHGKLSEKYIKRFAPVEHSFIYGMAFE